MNDFLPKDYVAPEAPGNYMEFEEGQNYFRALSSAIVGYQWWIENGEGRKPVRVREFDEVPEEFRNALNNRENARHFWAFTVYNYQAKAIQVLVLKQQTIMRAMEAFAKNPKWGNPKNYDLIVEKVRTGSRERDVEYNVILNRQVRWIRRLRILLRIYLSGWKRSTMGKTRLERRKALRLVPKPAKPGGNGRLPPFSLP
jgi:hypothetical protein